MVKAYVVLLVDKATLQPWRVEIMSEWPGTEIPHEQTWISTLVRVVVGPDFHNAAIVARFYMRNHLPALYALYQQSQVA